MQVVAAVLKSMLEEGRAAGLKGFEQVPMRYAALACTLCPPAGCACQAAGQRGAGLLRCRALLLHCTARRACIHSLEWMACWRDS